MKHLRFVGWWCPKLGCHVSPRAGPCFSQGWAMSLRCHQCNLDPILRRSTSFWIPCRRRWAAGFWTGCYERKDNHKRKTHGKIIGKPTGKWKWEEIWWICWDLEVSNVQHPCWLMICSGIILHYPSYMRDSKNPGTGNPVFNGLKGDLKGSEIMSALDDL